MKGGANNEEGGGGGGGGLKINNELDKYINEELDKKLYIGYMKKDRKLREDATSRFTEIVKDVKEATKIQDAMEIYFREAPFSPTIFGDEYNLFEYKSNEYFKKLNKFFILFLIEQFTNGNLDFYRLLKSFEDFKKTNEYLSGNIPLYMRHLEPFILMYQHIFNKLCPEFVKIFEKVQSNAKLEKKKEEDEQKRQKLNLILQENLKEFFQQKIQNLNDYMQLLEELYPNSNLRTTKINEIDILTDKYQQILAILG